MRHAGRLTLKHPRMADTRTVQDLLKEREELQRLAAEARQERDDLRVQVDAQRIQQDYLRKQVAARRWLKEELSRLCEELGIPITVRHYLCAFS